MSSNHLISSSIEGFYSKISDEDRFTQGLGPFELERIKELIKRYLRLPKSVVIDVGGGAGIYAEWLTGLGHNVHLVDPVQKHIKKARIRAAKLKHKFMCHLGESRDLSFPDNFADMVILHGPLYHLQSQKDRIKSLKEARRVVKKNGVIIGIAINYTSYTLVGLLNGMIHQSDFREMCKRHLLNGLHYPPENSKHLFLPEAYFHKPNELLYEFKEVNLYEIELLAVEGIVWLDNNFYQTREDPVKQKAIMSLLQLTEKDRYLISLSPHIMAVGKK